MARGSRQSGACPSREALLAYLQEQPEPLGAREIARAFGLRGAERQRLKDLLRELRRDGLLDGDAGDGDDDRDPGRLPPVAVIEVTGTDPDGELLAKPTKFPEGLPLPTIYLAPPGRGQPAPERGERVLARLKPIGEATYEASAIRVLGGAPRRILGIYDPGTEGGRLRPTDKRAKSEFTLKRADAAGAEAGELVLAEVVSRREGRLGLPQVKVVERIGALDASRALSLIAIQEHDIPTVFDPAAQEESAAAGPVEANSLAPEGPRVDLRDLDLVTIDGTDARDFDDAVWAEADPDPDNPGGWHLIVAIADVAHYVGPGSALDSEARERGNSTYFPDRVVPMLPEALSNGWCSLRPQEERACLAVDLWIDAEGTLRRHRFQRGLMRSTARLTYEQVQAAQDGNADATTAPLLDTVIAPLYGAYAALARGRDKRGVLDLDLPERRVRFDSDGQVAGIELRERLDSHRLIEEFMITANVAAAETLEAKTTPCLFRVHDEPDPQKIEALRQVLKTMDLPLARGQVLKPEAFNRVIRQTAELDEAPMISRLILQAQSQAAYAPRNIGHFGLALRRYAHFTSPIRRYSDLVVHRALIAALGLGDGGQAAPSPGDLEGVATHINATERRSQIAERDTLDRFAAAFLKDRIGAVFPARISGVTRFGLFATLDEPSADGLIPVSSLPDDYYDHDPDQQALIGRRWGRCYRLGERIEVRLTEVEPITGGIILTLTAGGGETAPNARPRRPQDRGRGRKIGRRGRPGGSRGKRRR